MMANTPRVRGWPGVQQGRVERVDGEEVTMTTTGPESSPGAAEESTPATGPGEALSSSAPPIPEQREAGSPAQESAAGAPTTADPATDLAANPAADPAARTAETPSAETQPGRGQSLPALPARAKERPGRTDRAPRRVPKSP